MISTSGVVLATVLERRFGARWLRRWRALADEEVRWSALHLADEINKGRKLASSESAILTIAAGRAKLPPTRRTDRSATSLFCALRAAQVWPLPHSESRAIPVPPDQIQSPDGIALNS